METVTIQQETKDHIECRIQLLYNARAIAAQNLHIANANFEKNYRGEKSNDFADMLVNAIRNYEAADSAYTKAL